MKKDFLKVLICVIMLTLVSIPAIAEVLTGFCGDNVTYTLDTESGLLKIEGTGTMEDYVYSKYDGIVVTTAPWGPYFKFIKKVEIADGVTSIGRYAFCGCSCLTSVDISNSVTNICTDSFTRCTGLTSIIIPNSVTSIGDEAFNVCM